MTFEKFNALPYKKKIDLIGSKVMGWTPGSGHMAEWNPLENIEDAWMIVRIMILSNFGVEFSGPIFKPENKYLTIDGYFLGAAPSAWQPYTLSE